MVNQHVKCSAVISVDPSQPSSAGSCDGGTISVVSGAAIRMGRADSRGPYAGYWRLLGRVTIMTYLSCCTSRFVYILRYVLRRAGATWVVAVTPVLRSGLLFLEPLLSS